MRGRAQVVLVTWLVGAGLSCGGPAPATAPGDADTGPCRTATTQAELTRCWSDESRDAEAKALATFVRVAAWLRDRDSTAALRAIEDGQATWAAYRDAHCGAVAEVYEGGSLGPMQEARCRAGLARLRQRELDALMSDAETDAAPDARNARTNRQARRGRFSACRSRLLARARIICLA